MPIEDPLTPQEAALLHRVEPTLSKNPPGIDLPAVLQRLRDATQAEIDGLSAEDIDYDNNGSGLTAEDVQAALDELAATGTGDVFGPAGALDRGMPVFAGVTGKTLADSGIRNYGKLAADPPGTGAPGDPIPADGDEYYNTTLRKRMFYDGSRSKWLSIETESVAWGRSGATPPGAYFRTSGNIIMAGNRGHRTKYAATIVEIHYRRTDVDAATFEVAGNGVATGAELASMVTGDEDVDLNVDVAQGVTLGVRVKAGSNDVSNASGVVTLRWRSA